MRNRIAAVVVTVVLLLLAGCGGGGGSAKVAAVDTPAPYSLSGKVSLNGAGLGQVTLALSGAGSQFSDGNGNYSFTHLANGSYTVTPSRSGYTFTPASQTVTISDNGVVLNFTASAIPSYTLSGTVSGSNGAGLAGATVTVAAAGTGSTLGTKTTDGSGKYSLSGVTDGSYVVSVSHPDGYSFTPASRAVTVQGGDLSADFSAPVATFALSGTVASGGGTALANVALVLSSQNGAVYRTVTDAGGNYAFGGIPDGYYSMTPTLSGYAFVPNPLLVQVNGADSTGNAITAAPVTSGTGSLSISF